MSDLISRADAISVLDNFTQTDTLGHTPRQIVEALPSAQPDKRLEKIADLVEGTIDHFDRDDAIDLLYQIKEVLNER